MKREEKGEKGGRQGRERGGRKKGEGRGERVRGKEGDIGSKRRAMREYKS